MLAARVAKQLLKSGRHSVVSVWARSPKKVAGFASRFGAKAYPTLEEAAGAEDAEAVYVVTPHSVHYEHTLRALKLGKPVLTEKAFTINASQAEELALASKKSGTFLSEAMWTWFNPNVRWAAELARSGKYGKVKSIRAKLCFSDKIRALFQKRPRFYDLHYGAGSLLDVGVYPIALAYLFLGKPDEIECEMKMWHGFDEYDRIILTYNGGTKCYLASSYRKIESETAVIEMENGKIVIPFFHKARSARVISGGVTEKVRLPGGYVHEFDRLESDVREGRTESSVIPLECTLDIMRIMDECRKQNGFVYPEEIEAI